MKKSLLVIMALLCALTLLAGCGAKNEEPETTAPAAPVTTEKETVDLMNINPLTGEYFYPDESVGHRPVAVMVNNVPEAMPQYGIEAADIVYEIPVEGNQTRFLAIYPDYNTLPDICSVRSCRYYYPALALGYDAIYIHWGIDYTIYPYYNSLDMDKYDLNILDDDPTGLASRDQERLSQQYNLEHTSVFHGTNLPKVLKEDDVRLELKDDMKDTAFKFSDPLKDPVIPTGENCTDVYIRFGGQDARLAYDATTNKYLKYIYDEEQIDGRTKKQLAFTNVIILETTITSRDEVDHKHVEWEGGDDSSAYWISNGKMQKIHWKKADEYSRLKLYDEDGKELTINPGKTYIAINYYDSTYFSDPMSETEEESGEADE
ncbi:MAG: DUF3048 domain-containing protein [Parasporobacterium sp.]|nr:DUF3048 domain-containing protein [Parasporobacterium sp.]